MKDPVAKVLRINSLYDLYGALLSERQKKVIEWYYEENLSLNEIAENEHISKNAVHDALHKAELFLEEYEKKMKLLEKEEKKAQHIEKLFLEKHLDEIAYKELKGD